MRFLVPLLSLVLAACAGGDDPSQGDGNDGKGGLKQGCFGNGTCNPGLSCIAGICADTSRGGELQCCHQEDASCDLESLTCVGAPGLPICLRVGSGGIHQKCYANGTCNAGLSCNGLACVNAGESPPDCSLTQGQGGTGQGGTGNAGTGTAGTNTAGTGTAGTGTSGTGGGGTTAVGGTGGPGTGGTGTGGTGGTGMTCSGCVCSGAPSAAWDNFCVMQCMTMCTAFISCEAIPVDMKLPTCACTCG